MTDLRIKATRNSRGTALVVSLLLLLVATLIGVTAVQVVSMEERMAASVRSKHIAFHAAESALRSGEAFLLNQIGELACGTTGLYKAECPLTGWDTGDEWADFSCTVANSRGYDIDEADRSSVDGGTLSGVYSKPRFLIEELSHITCEPSGSEGGVQGTEHCYFKVTACGYGSSSASTVILQSTFKR